MPDRGVDPYASPEPRKQRGAGLGVVVGVLSVTVLLAGILTVLTDDGGGDADPVALLSAAPDAVREAGSARMSMTMSFAGEGFNVEMAGTGVVDFETGAGTFEMNVLGQTIEMRTDGETVWMHLPDPIPGSPITAPWIAVPADQLQSSPQAGAGIDSATGMLDALRGIGGDVEEVGGDVIDGVEVTHYHVVVDLRDAIAAAPEVSRARAEAALQQFSQLGATEMPIDVWITDGGLPIRQIMRWAPEGVAGVPDGFEMEMRVDLSDFGTPVEVEAPPADQVQTIDPMQLQQIFGGTPTAQPAAA